MSKRRSSGSLTVMLVTGVLLASCMTSEALAGAHKWETAAEEYGPGIILSSFSENRPQPSFSIWQGVW